MIWMFFIACVGREKEKNIALCDQASEGFLEYLTEIEENQDNLTCETDDDCSRSRCRSICGVACVEVLSNEDLFVDRPARTGRHTASGCQARWRYA